MSRIDELRLMVKIARMYYERGLRQSVIASQLKLSQATVSRLLKRAEEEHIVRITVQIPKGIYTELEEELEQKYKIREAIVVDTSQDDEQQIMRDLGAAAAAYLETTVSSGEIIGLSSWSETLLAMVDALQPVPRIRDVKVVQILGGVGNPAVESHATHLTRRLANLLNGEAIFLPAPGVAGSPETAKLYMEDQFVRSAMAMFDRLTMALVGIGAVEPSKLLASSGNSFSPEELDRLHQEGAVGDICLRFFNIKGEPVGKDLSERVISISLEQLRHLPSSVGIAGGHRKLQAIRGALEGRWINVLITDRFTAEKLLDC